MGLKTWYSNQMDRHKESQSAVGGYYGVHSVSNGEYSYLPEGRFKKVRKPIAGAIAEFESGASNQKTTAGRVVAGAVIAGPVGAVVGGLLKKDKTKCYVTVTFADGDVAIIDGPVKDERRLREFAVKINAASRHYSE